MTCPRAEPRPVTARVAHGRRSDSCFNCKGPGGEDVSGGYYEAGGSFLKLGIVESFLVRSLVGSQSAGTPQRSVKSMRSLCSCVLSLLLAAREFV